MGITHEMKSTALAYAYRASHLAESVEQGETMSIPYLGQEFTFPQPDGTYLQVRGFGNQDTAVFETLDGFTVTKDPVTGFYQYAALSSDGNDLVPTGYQAERVNPRNLGLAKNIRSN